MSPAQIQDREVEGNASSEENQGSPVIDYVGGNNGVRRGWRHLLLLWVQFFVPNIDPFLLEPCSHENFNILPINIYPWTKTETCISQPCHFFFLGRTCPTLLIQIRNLIFGDQKKRDVFFFSLSTSFFHIHPKYRGVRAMCTLLFTRKREGPFFYTFTATMSNAW